MSASPALERLSIRFGVIHTTERHVSEERKAGARIEPYLFLALEGARLSAGGLRVALLGLDELALGRGDARVLTRSRPTHASLQVPDNRMSGAHVRLVRRGDRYLLEDLGSTNGTRVNGQVVASHVLVSGDLVEVGQSVFLYREIEEDAPARSGDLDASQLAADLGIKPGFATLDPNLARQLGRVARLATTPISLLLLGETGTGKEVLTRAVHMLSKRPGPFVAVNCGAIPANLVEAHLFGHVRGAFSGAAKDEPGMVRAAHGGTLMLDEIGDLPMGAQAALLRVLQEGEVLPVGSAQATKVDVRIVAATHVHIEQQVERGLFRQDLFARLAGYTFLLPPLRERKVDLGVLIASLLASGKIPGGADVRLHRDAARAIVRHDWPMNVRELEQCLRAACALAENGLITLADLPAALALAPVSSREAADDVGDGEAEALRRELLLRLVECGGNVTEVARVMGKARQQIQRWLRRFQIDPEAYRRR